MEDPVTGTVLSLHNRTEAQRQAIAKQLLTAHGDGGKHASRKSAGSLLGRGRDGGAASLLAGKIVYRHLLDGDVLLTNRQPTLHKPGALPFSLRCCSCCATAPSPLLSSLHGCSSPLIRLASVFFSCNSRYVLLRAFSWKYFLVWCDLAAVPSAARSLAALSSGGLRGMHCSIYLSLFADFSSVLCQICGHTSVAVSRQYAIFVCQRYTVRRAWPDRSSGCSRCMLGACAMKRPLLGTPIRSETTSKPNSCGIGPAGTVVPCTPMRMLRPHIPIRHRLAGVQV